MTAPYPEPVVRGAILDAVNAGDWDAVKGLLRRYALWYPRDCETLMAAVDFAAGVSDEPQRK